MRFQGARRGLGPDGRTPPGGAEGVDLEELAGFACPQHRFDAQSSKIVTGPGVPAVPAVGTVPA